jgi:hypothetical protein
MAEQDKKYMGVVFKRHDEAGIARISITNTTTATVVLANKDVDLYDAQYDISADATVWENYCFWWNVEPATDSYSMQVELSPDTTAGRYLEIMYYLTNAPLTDGGTTTVLTTWHEDYLSDLYTYTLITDAVTSLDKIQYFNGDDVTTDFTLAVTNHAHEFVEFSDDGGTTWKFPTDTLITWGSNVTYDDETIDDSGNFTVKFLTAPITGVSNIAIKFQPKVTHYNLTRTMNQPYTTGYIDYQKEVRLLSDALELIP